MFKKLLITVLTIVFLSTSALIAAELDNGDATEYKVTKSETTQIIGGGSGGGSFTFSSPWSGEQRTFDNVIDQMYYNQFGDGFEIIQRHSTDINRVINHANWQLEVLSTVTIAERSFMSTIWPDNVIFNFDEETGTWSMIDGETGEVILEEELEKVKRTPVRVQTFFSLKNTSSEIDLTSGINVGFVEDFSNRDSFWGHANFVHFDEETGIAYLIATHSTSLEELGDNISIDFTINRILAEWKHFIDEVEIDFAYHLENHEATFVVENCKVDSSGWPRGRSGSASGELREILGEDFDPFSMDTEIMTRGELSISLAHGVYLSNIAFRDNILLVQTSRQDDRHSSWPQESWTHVSLIDTRIEAIDWEKVSTMNEEAAAELFDLHMNRYIQSLYSIDVSLMDENFQLIGDRRYMEEAFYIENLELLNYLAFEVSHGYFAIVQSVNLVVPSFLSPVINQSLALETNVEIVIYGTTYTIKDIEISPLEISFVIDNPQRLLDVMDSYNNRHQWFDLGEHIQVELINVDGTEGKYSIRSIGWGTSWENDKVTELRAFFGGSVLDIDNLAAIRVNGVLVELQ